MDSLLFFIVNVVYCSHRSSLLRGSAVEPVAGQPPRPSRPPLRPVVSLRARGPETGDPEMDGAALREMVNAPLPPPEEGRVENLLFPFLTASGTQILNKRAVSSISGSPEGTGGVVRANLGPRSPSSLASERLESAIRRTTARMQYTFKVFAVAADHVTEGRSTEISRYTKPDVIRNLTVNEITTSSVFLTWNEPIGNRSFFKIQWTDNRPSGNSTYTSYNITGLTAGVSYTFCITAVAADDSTEGGTVCVSQYTKPDIIMNLTAHDITTSSVLLKWTKPNGQSSHYRIEYEDKNVITENTSIIINDLIPGTQNTFKVFAVAADHVTEGRSSQISLYTKSNTPLIVGVVFGVICFLFAIILILFFYTRRQSKQQSPDIPVHTIR
ncbi:receptor-type tyrosine- phosphatase eta-like protein [Labeo rohita]|uniref:Receptor-type tyrosine-phosphatase eta-like protein n=1 Tax=Labeo rohita TaxID=84645 RepID=A0A498L807_LABRO|nr:receptor-type tyrosine- phosphatase eta-like protein [Labeo rohita]